VQAKIVKIGVVSVLALLLLTAAAVSMAGCDADELRAIVGSRDVFLAFCVVTHLMTICLLSWYTATAPTLASRRSYAMSTMASSVQLTCNLYLAMAVSFLLKLCWSVPLKLCWSVPLNFGR
jgi:hypothetical protein